MYEYKVDILINYIFRCLIEHNFGQHLLFFDYIFAPFRIDLSLLLNLTNTFNHQL